MVILGHTNGNDTDFRYDTAEESDRLVAVDKLEVFLRGVDQKQKKKAMLPYPNLWSYLKLLWCRRRNSTNRQIRSALPHQPTVLNCFLNQSHPVTFRSV